MLSATDIVGLMSSDLNLSLNIKNMKINQKKVFTKYILLGICFLAPTLGLLAQQRAGSIDITSDDIYTTIGACCDENTGFTVEAWIKLIDNVNDDFPFFTLQDEDGTGKESFYLRYRGDQYRNGNNPWKMYWARPGTNKERFIGYATGDADFVLQFF